MQTTPCFQLWTAVALGFAAVISCPPSHAQEAHSHSHAGNVGEDHDHTGEFLAFQMKDWKTMHFEDSRKAEQHLQTVSNLGCEVRKDAHAGHIDVAYRCVEWKEIQVENHELAEQWIGWLKGSGFDVSHGHVDEEFTVGPESVSFRMVEWKAMHGDGSPEAKQFVDFLGKIGCEVRVEQHAGHSDMRFRAPIWRDIHLADHAAAEQWSGWLKSHGFEVRHTH